MACRSYYQAVGWMLFLADLQSLGGTGLVTGQIGKSKMASFTYLWSWVGMNEDESFLGLYFSFPCKVKACLGECWDLPGSSVSYNCSLCSPDKPLELLTFEEGFLSILSLSGRRKQQALSKLFQRSKKFSEAWSSEKWDFNAWMGILNICNRTLGYSYSLFSSLSHTHSHFHNLLKLPFSNTCRLRSLRKAHTGAGEMAQCVGVHVLWTERPEFESQYLCKEMCTCNPGSRRLSQVGSGNSCHRVVAQKQ